MYLSATLSKMLKGLNGSLTACLSAYLAFYFIFFSIELGKEKGFVLFSVAKINFVAATLLLMLLLNLLETKQKKLF